MHDVKLTFVNKTKLTCAETLFYYQVIDCNLYSLSAIDPNIAQLLHFVAGVEMQRHAKLGKLFVLKFQSILLLPDIGLQAYNMLIIHIV